MPFYSNSTYGTVAHTSGTFYDQGKILANDGSSLSSATLATQSALSIPVAGYERVMGIYTICYNTDTTNELSYRISVLDNADTPAAIATKLATHSLASISEATASSATASAANLECTGTYSTNGTGVTINVDTTVADASALWLQVSFNAQLTANTKGNIVFQAANITGTATGTNLVAGSNVIYKKW